MKLKLTFSLITNHVLSATFIILGGCAAKQAVEGFTPRGFIEIKEEAKNEATKRLPFDYVWRNPQAKFVNYKKIQIAPFNLSYIDSDSWKNSLSAALTNKEDFDRHVQNFSTYFEGKLKESLSKATNPRFILTDSPGEDTLRLELAITKVSFGSPTAYAASFASPIPGTGIALDAVRSYLASFELRLVDSVSGDLLGTAADQKSPRLRPIDLNKLSVSSPLKEVADIWVDELTRSINAPSDQKVKGASRISLLPW